MNEPIEMSFRKDSLDAIKTHTDLLRLHYRALGCHSEVMGMMSENAYSVCIGQLPAFENFQFRNVMQKWGLIDENGEPII